MHASPAEFVTNSLLLYLQAATLAVESKVNQLRGLCSSLDHKVKSGFELMGCLQKGAQALREKCVQVSCLMESVLLSY
jgi:hypothetical protein